MKNIIKEYIIITIGSFLITCGLYFFLAPTQLAAGGISGLSIVLKEIFPSISLGVIMMFLEIIMFGLGFLFIGGGFGVKTIYCSFSISIFMIILDSLIHISSPLSHDTIVVLIFGVLLTSGGQALIFNYGASSGGTDIIAKIITKHTPINIGLALQIADFFVICAAIGVFGIEKGLYGLLGILINGFLIDYFIDGFNVAKLVVIVSSNTEEINDYIIKALDRSATVYVAKGAYTKQAKEVITTVVDRSQFIQLKNYINSIDPAAFVTVQQLHEVMGEGFTKKE